MQLNMCINENKLLKIATVLYTCGVKLQKISQTTYMKGMFCIEQYKCKNLHHNTNNKNNCYTK